MNDRGDRDLGSYSTIVIGAGPAGVMAALEASAKGTVLLAERGGLPRNKSCGGMLNEYAQDFLARFGEIPARLVLDPEHVRFRYVDWDRRIAKPTTLTFVNVDRAGFDEWLMSLLPDGIVVAERHELTGFEQTEERVRLTFKTPDGTASAEAEAVIGCDGARSRTRRLLGVASTSTYVTLQDFVHHEGGLEPYFDCIYLRDIGDEFGYAYVVPKGSRAIVGSVFYPGTKRPWEKHDLVLELLRNRMPALGESLEREAAVALSVRSPGDVVCGSGRVLLAGEAAGFMSPSSGEGISYALNTGREAGAAVARAGGREALGAYTRATAPVTANIRRKLRWLPFMESRAGKYLAGFVPAPLVSRVTKGL